MHIFGEKFVFQVLQKRTEKIVPASQPNQTEIFGRCLIDIYLLDVKEINVVLNGH